MANPPRPSMGPSRKPEITTSGGRCTGRLSQRESYTGLTDRVFGCLSVGSSLACSSGALHRSTDALADNSVIGGEVTRFVRSVAALLGAIAVVAAASVLQVPAAGKAQALTACSRWASQAGSDLADGLSRRGYGDTLSSRRKCDSAGGDRYHRLDLTRPPSVGDFPSGDTPCCETRSGR